MGKCRRDQPVTNDQPVSMSTGRIQEMLKTQLEEKVDPNAGKSSGVTSKTVGKGGGKKRGVGGKEDVEPPSTFYPEPRDTTSAELDSEKMWADAFSQLLQLGEPRQSRGARSQGGAR